MDLKTEISKFQQCVELHKYEHIVFAVIEAIQTEKAKVGDKLPSMNEMHEITGYSRATIDKGYKSLKGKGLVKGVNHKGCFITSTKIKAIHTAPLKSLITQISLSKSINK